MVTVGGDEDLGLVHEPAESLGVDKAISVALEIVAHTVWRLRPLASRAAPYGPRGERSPVQMDSGIRGSHVIRPMLASWGPTSLFPGAWARTWARTTLRTLSFGPVRSGA